MKKKHARIAAILVFVFSALMICTGCDAMKYIPIDNMNETEMLEAEEVAKLLNGNGANLLEASDFPLDVSLCRIYDTTPLVYFSDRTGLYYLFYEFDDYQKAQSARYKPYSGLEEYSKKFLDPLFTFSIAGKNLSIFLWYPGFVTTDEYTKTIEGEAFQQIEKELVHFRDILYKKAFDQKSAVLTGSGDSWEVVMPIEYIYNVRQAKGEAGKFFFASGGKTYLKYIGAESALPEVYQIQWQKPHGSSTMSTDEGTLVGETDLYGFRKISSSDPGFNPETDESVTVTITWGDGESEEIVCTPKRYWK